MIKECFWIQGNGIVDKSMLIADINKSLNTDRKLSCVSRPRRFGKSFIAKMLVAYYDKSVDSFWVSDI